MPYLADTALFGDEIDLVAEFLTKPVEILDVLDLTRRSKDSVLLVRQRDVPRISDVFRLGPDTAAVLLITVGDNPDRLRFESPFAHLCGVAPIPASSGKTTRHRLDRGGDRRANQALHPLSSCA